MSASQSYLSSPQFGYDLVVATTQGSINAALQEFLSSGSEPEVVVCYVADSDGNPTPIDYQTLVANANGSDPFSVPPNADPNTDTDLQNLFKARFLAGFKAQIGVPPGYVPADAPPETPPKPTIPDLVVLGADVSSVTFNLLCSEFIVVQYTPSSGYSPAQWLSMSQPDGNAWIFSSTVDLHLVQGQPPYSNLPLAIQNQILNLGGTAFSVQQLLFDLDNAKLQTMPTISGVPSGSPLDTLLTTYFLDEYFNTMQQNGQPLLGCTITVGTSGSSVPAPSITPSNLTFETCPLLDSNGQPIVANSNQDGQAPTQSQLDACTLNYLCAAGGDSLPPAVPFDWNWVEENEQSQFDGVMAINRNAFVNYLRSKLDGYVAQNCLQPHVDVNLDKVGWSMSNGTPTVTTPASGAIVLSYSYQADDEHSSALDANKMKLATNYSLVVTLSGSSMTVDQHLQIFVYIREGVSSDGGNVVDKEINELYTLGVDGNGNLTAAVVSTPTDNSKTPGVNGFLNFFTDLNDLTEDVADWARNVSDYTLRDLPLNIVQSYVFPGGKTFLFNDASFSNNQDLVAHITYLDPS